MSYFTENFAQNSDQFECDTGLVNIKSDHWAYHFML